MAGVDGGDGGWAYTYGASPVSSTNLDLVIDEDQIGGAERSHTTEQVGYAVFGSTPNNTPVAYDQVVTTPEDTPKSITLTASDMDGDTLTYEIASLPGHGTLSGTAPSLTYTPEVDYNGDDSFTFRASDGKVDSNTATVMITVTLLNDAPVADDQNVTTQKNTAVTSRSADRYDHTHDPVLR